MAGKNLELESVENKNGENQEACTERLSFLQKIDTLLVMRRKNKAEFRNAVGISRTRLSRYSSGGGLISCAEIRRIAEYFDAKARVTIRIPGGRSLSMDLVGNREDVSVPTRDIGEMFGVECELEFVLEDLGKVI